MWIRVSKDRILNVRDIRSFVLAEGEQDEEKVFVVKAYFKDGTTEPFILYISKDEEAIKTVFDNLEKVLQAGRVVKLHDKQEEAADA